MKYVATIYFDAEPFTDVEKAIEVAADRMENFSPDITIDDTHVEEYDDNIPTNNQTTNLPNE